MRLSVLAFVVICATPAFAQSVAPAPLPAPSSESTARSRSSTDYFLASGQWDRLTSARGGGTGSADWLRETTNGRTYTAGLSVSSIADSRWAFAKSGFVLRPTDRLIVHAQARVGGGNTTATRFAYRAYEGGVAYRVAAGVYLTFADQYVHVAETRGHLLKPGLAYALSRRVTTEVAYARSVGGNLGAEQLGGRVMVAVREMTLVGGFAAGSTAPEVVNVGFGGEPMTRGLKEGFVGVQMRVERAQLTLMWSDLALDPIHKRTLTASVKYPLRLR